MNQKCHFFKTANRRTCSLYFPLKLPVKVWFIQHSGFKEEIEDNDEEEEKDQDVHDICFDSHEIDQIEVLEEIQVEKTLRKSNKSQVDS
jgi:hypothetical protein